VCWSSYWPTCYLVFLRHQTSQFLNTAQLFGTTAWGNIRQKRLRRSRGELFALLIQWQRLCHTGWRCSMLSFRLFQIGATNFAVIFFRKFLNPSKCIHYLLPPPRDTEITSRLRKTTLFPRPRNRTNCYKSFIHHALITCIHLHSHNNSSTQSNNKTKYNKTL